MTIKDAVKLSGRSAHWLRNHECGLCAQTLLRALQYGCGAIWTKCEPTQKDFSDKARAKHD